MAGYCVTGRGKGVRKPGCTDCIRLELAATFPRKIMECFRNDRGYQDGNAARADGGSRDYEVKDARRCGDQ